MCPYSKGVCFCKAPISCTVNYLRVLAQAFTVIGRNLPQSTEGSILQKAIMMGKLHLSIEPVVKRILYFSLPLYSAYLFLFFLGGYIINFYLLITDLNCVSKYFFFNSGF